jgi:hypothetical protein
VPSGAWPSLPMSALVALALALVATATAAVPALAQRRG